MFSATPVPAFPLIVDLGLLVHPRGVVADVAVHGDLHRRVHPDRDIVGSVGMADDELAGQVGCVQRCVDVAQRSGAQVECPHLFHA